MSSLLVPHVALPGNSSDGVRPVSIGPSLLPQQSDTLGTMATHIQYQHIPDVQSGLATRRMPFSNTGNQMPVMQTARPGSPQKIQKQPSSPPLPRQNTKTAPPSPPKVIHDKAHAVSYSRVGFLGEVSNSKGCVSSKYSPSHRVALLESTRCKIGIVNVKQSRWSLRLLSRRRRLKQRSSRFLRFSPISNLLLCSCMQKSRYTVPFHTRTLSSLVIVSKTARTSI